MFAKKKKEDQANCKKCDKVVDVVGDVGLRALGFTETWLTGDISDQRINCLWCDICLFSLYHAARPHRKRGEFSTLIHNSLKSQKYSRFQIKSFENYQLAFISRNVSVQATLFTGCIAPRKRSESWRFLQRISWIWRLSCHQEWTSVDPWRFQCS